MCHDAACRGSLVNGSGERAVGLLPPSSAASALPAGAVPGALDGSLDNAWRRMCAASELAPAAGAAQPAPRLHGESAWSMARAAPGNGTPATRPWPRSRQMSPQWKCRRARDERVNDCSWSDALRIERLGFRRLSRPEVEIPINRRISAGRLLTPHGVAPAPPRPRVSFRRSISTRDNWIHPSSCSGAASVMRRIELKGVQELAFIHQRLRVVTTTGPVECRQSWRPAK